MQFFVGGEVSRLGREASPLSPPVDETLVSHMYACCTIYAQSKCDH